MTLESIKEKLKESSIFHSEEHILNHHSVVGYEKEFRLRWMATQLNTFIIATDFGEEEITKSLIKTHVSQSFTFSEQHYNGWTRGFQASMGVISILISRNVSEEAKAYCLNLRSGHKWAAFSIPVVYDTETKELFFFQKNPMWGMMFYPHFKKVINKLID